MSALTNAKNKAMAASREGKLQHFYSLAQSGQTILDVGVSPERKKGPPTRNYFLKNYRFDPATYTGLGVQDLQGMDDLFPGMRFVQYRGGRFPFADDEFDWVFSNAVIEHVGDGEAQLMFVNEMLRIARHVFFTTPNKFFPVESHTNVFFLHWHNATFYRWHKGRKPWVTKERLYLFSYRRLRDLLEASDAAEYRVFRNRMLGIPMTFTVVCRG